MVRLCVVALRSLFMQWSIGHIWIWCCQTGEKLRMTGSAEESALIPCRMTRDQKITSRRNSNDLLCSAAAASLIALFLPSCCTAVQIGFLKPLCCHATEEWFDPFSREKSKALLLHENIHQRKHAMIQPFAHPGFSSLLFPQPLTPLKFWNCYFQNFETAFKILKLLSKFWNCFQNFETNSSFKTRLKLVSESCFAHARGKKLARHTNVACDATSTSD